MSQAEKRFFGLLTPLRGALALRPVYREQCCSLYTMPQFTDKLTTARHVMNNAIFRCFFVLFPPISLPILWIGNEIPCPQWRLCRQSRPRNCPKANHASPRGKFQAHITI